MTDQAGQMAEVTEPSRGVTETPGVQCKVQDLSLGDQIHLAGFDGARTVRAATKIRKGPDRSKLEVTLHVEADSVSGGPRHPRKTACSVSQFF
jgi:hypothetical protein